jgi:general secretion pathway protein G
MKNLRKRSRRAFTLLELMLVMAILVILASFGTVYVLNMQRSAKIDATLAQIGMLAQSCKAFKMDMGYFPNSLDDLIAMPAGATANKWRGPYLDNASVVPLDQWDNQFTYTADETNNRVQIVSSGPDRQANTPDDVTNRR